MLNEYVPLFKAAILKEFTIIPGGVTNIVLHATFTLLLPTGIWTQSSAEFDFAFNDGHHIEVSDKV